MAKDIKLGESKLKHSDPVCKAAEHCCWYETSREFSDVCSHRNELICHLRREEVFGENQMAADKLPEAALVRY